MCEWYHKKTCLSKWPTSRAWIIYILYINPLFAFAHCLGSDQSSEVCTYGPIYIFTGHVCPKTGFHLMQLGWSTFMSYLLKCWKQYYFKWKIKRKSYINPLTKLDCIGILLYSCKYIYMRILRCFFKGEICSYLRRTDTLDKFLWHVTSVHFFILPSPFYKWDNLFWQERICSLFCRRVASLANVFITPPPPKTKSLG